MAKSPFTNSAKPNPLLVLVRGVPGSGKSYLVTALRETLSSENVHTIDPDAIDVANPNYISFADQLRAEGLREEIHAFRWLRHQACQAFEPGAIVIWDQPFTDEGVFNRLVLYLRDSAKRDKSLTLDVLIIEIHVPADIAKKRVAARKEAGGHGPSEKTFAKRLKAFESFSDTYDVLKLDGEKDIEQLAQQAAKKIASIRNS